MILYINRIFASLNQLKYIQFRFKNINAFITRCHAYRFINSYFRMSLFILSFLGKGHRYQHVTVAGPYGSQRCLTYSNSASIRCIHIIGCWYCKHCRLKQLTYMFVIDSSILGPCKTQSYSALGSSASNSAYIIFSYWIYLWNGVTKSMLVMIMDTSKVGLYKNQVFGV